MRIEDSKDIFRTLILIARPAAGKSEIIDYLSKLSPHERKKDFHIGQLKIIDDFPFLWRWFEEDELLETMDKPRLFTNNNGYFKFNYLWDLLINMINLNFVKYLKEEGNREDKTILIEFSRGKEHGGYHQALPLLSDDILKEAAVLYVDVPWEESLRKNKKRFNPDKPDSILEHGLPDEKLKKLYFDCDFKELVSGKPDFLILKNIKVPYTIFENKLDLTTRQDQEFVASLREELDKLWELRNQD